MIAKLTELEKRIRRARALALLIITSELIALISIIVSNFFPNLTGYSVFDQQTSSKQIVNSTRPDIPWAIPTYWPQFSRPSQDPVLLQELKPNFSQKFDGHIIQLLRVTTVSINSDGFRDREFDIQKAPNTFRIIVLGDSLTFGWGVENEEAYPKVLEKLLNLNSNRKYEVLNFGVQGYNTVQEVRMLELKGLKYKPDMVILGYHRSDLENKTRAAEITEELYQKYPDYRYSKESQIKITLEVGERLRREIALTPFSEIWKIVEEPLSKLTNLSREYKFSVVVVDLDSPETHYLQLLEESKKYNWLLINARDILSASVNQNFPPIDGHPNVRGHELIAERIYNSLQKIV